MRVSGELSQQGAALYNLALDDLRFLGGEDGDVYEGRDADGPFIFKLVPSGADGVAKARARLDFARYLSDGGVRIARPIPSPSGAMLEVVDKGGLVVVASKVTKAPGRHPNPGRPSEWNADLFRKWGRVVGQMHRLTKTYPGARAFDHWHDEVDSFIDWCKDPDVQPFWHRMRVHLETLPTDGDCYGVVHNDLHFHNFMLQDGEITVFDFDVCHQHWFMVDLGIALFHALWGVPLDEPVRRERFAEDFLTSFLRGYEGENHLADSWLRELPTFAKYRQLLLFTVFTDSWGGPDVSSWQRRWIRTTRKQIINDEPVVSLDAFFAGR